MRKMLLLLALVASTPMAMASGQAYVPIEQRLSADQLRATGLDTLSQEQMTLLNRLLSDDRTQALRAAETQRAVDEAGLRDKRPPVQAVTATVNGEVRALSQGQTVTLDNGQRWRVVERDLTLPRPVSNPKVTISPGVFGAWYLRMEEVPVPVKVQRVD